MSMTKTWNSPPSIRHLTGDKSLRLNGQPFPDTRVLDFWRWAFSDLRMNSIRGVLAEYIVARLLDIPLLARGAWESYDLKTPDEITIEVKSAAYLQAWEQLKPSQIVFSGLRTRSWTPQAGYGEECYGSDIYVFCLLAEQDPHRFDPLDLDQWQFWLLPQIQVVALCNNGKSLSLTRLQRASMLPYLAHELQERGSTILRQVMEG